MSLYAGVGALNAILLATGYCLLAASLWGRSLSCWVSYAGVALLAGAGVVGTGVLFAYMCGAPNGAVALASAAVASAGAGLAATRWRRWRAFVSAPPAPERTAPSRVEATAETAALTAVAVIAAVAFVRGFRSSPWLDDVWGIWVPKGRALDKLGLDPRLFAPAGPYDTFGVLNYPLWWSGLTGLDLRFVRYVDLRAVDGQSTLLVLGFFATAGRLLWGHVRPWLIAAALLLLAESPEFFRHLQGGLADLALAIYFSLCVAAAVGWIATGRGFYLLLATAFGFTAIQIKTEALPQLAVVAVLTLAVAWRVAPARVRALVVSWAIVFVGDVPWAVWRHVHDVASHETVPLSRALSPSFLSDRYDRLGPSAETVARHLFVPHEWALVVPLALCLALLVAFLERRPIWLSPWLLVAALYLLWIWIYWTHPDPLDYILQTSSYRTVDATILTAWFAVPLLAERALRNRRGTSAVSNACST
jgi:hypothetical protein